MFATSYRPELNRLEDRVQPGSIISTGMDLSLLAGSFIGQSLISSAMPSDSSVADRVTTQGVSENQPATNDSGAAVNPAPAQPLEMPGTENIMNLQTGHDLTVLPSATLSHQAGSNLGGNGVHNMIPPNALFYGGDFDGRNGLSNEHGTLVSDSQTWDNFYVTDSGDGLGWQITTVFNRSLNRGGETANSCNWAIRSGVHAGSGGNIATLYSSGGATAPAMGTAPSTYMPTGNSGFGLPEYEIVVDLSSLPINQILPGKYYLDVQPNGSGVGQWFESTATNGSASSIGQQDPGDSWFNSSYFGYTWSDTQNLLGSGTWNFSNGVCGNQL
jgi:hypothetical protein